MKKYILLLVAVVLSTPMAFAKDGGVYIEPMLTYEHGDAEINFPSPLGSSDTDIKGFGLGARLGAHLRESVFLAIDGRYSWTKFDDGRTGINTDATGWNYGPVLGVQLPWVVGLRVWGGYIMDGELNPDKDNGIDAKFEDGKGYRIGAGLKLAMVSLNLEYQNMTFEKTKVDQVGGFNSGASLSGVELDNKSWVLSVSFPLSL